MKSIKEIQYMLVTEFHSNLNKLRDLSFRYNQSYILSNLKPKFFVRRTQNGAALKATNTVARIDVQLQ